MRLWLSKSSEVPIRVQLEAQIILGILSNDLKANQRLPSTRELARRYKIHSNTVSAAYRQLAGKGGLTFAKAAACSSANKHRIERMKGILRLID